MTTTVWVSPARSSVAPSFRCCASYVGLEHEDAFEAYYNVAVTDWLTATADIQVINQALNRQLNPGGSGLLNVGHATIGGIRFRARF